MELANSVCNGGGCSCKLGHWGPDHKPIKVHRNFSHWVQRALDQPHMHNSSLACTHAQIQTPNIENVALNLFSYLGECLACGMNPIHKESEIGIKIYLLLNLEFWTFNCCSLLEEQNRDLSWLQPYPRGLICHSSKTIHWRNTLFDSLVTR